ncbi:MAG: zinc metalloprotease [Planctomycetota bacterium]|jgi:Zn-dependent protease
MNPAIFAVYVIGFFVVIKLLLYAGLVKALLGIRFKKGDCQLRNPSDVPAYLDDLFAAYESRLRQLGFHFSHCQLSDEPVVTTHSKKWNVVYFNPAQDCYAGVSVSPMPDRNSPARVEFISFFSDDHKLLTVNGMAHDIIDEVPNTFLLDPYAESLEKQFQTHLAELSRLRQEKTIIAREPSAFVADEKKTVDDYLNSLQANGFIKETKDNHYRLRLLPALRHAYKALKGLKKLKTMQAKMRKLSQAQKTPLIEAPVEAEAEAFSRIQQMMTSKKMGYMGKIAVFLVSLLLFMAAFRISFSFNTVLVLITAIFLHELGHVLGMRLFKHKDVQVLFLPFMGAATIGEQKKTTALQSVIIYLLGPAPGILLGTCCLLLYRAYSVWFLNELGLFLLVLNYINLLPLLPLDGGRVFELALFSRFWFLKVAFLTLSIAVMAMGAILFKDPILIAISLFLGIGLWPQIQQSIGLSKLNKKIKAENLDRSDEILVPAIFSLLKERPFNKLPFARKFQVAKHLLNNAMKKPPTFGISLLSMFMYLVVLLLPIFIIFVVAVYGVVFKVLWD